MIIDFPFKNDETISHFNQSRLLTIINYEIYFIIRILLSTNSSSFQITQFNTVRAKKFTFIASDGSRKVMILIKP